MKCGECEGKGWTEGWQGGAASWTPSLQQCKHRCNISGYSHEVMRRLNTPDHVTERMVVRAAPTQAPPAKVVSLHSWRQRV